jgi:hypothetical protein
MDNRSPILRFGILSDGKRSSYWRVRAGVARPELFLERESFGKRWHFSLHASGRWHMKEGSQERISWARPDEIVPGYTRAVAIVQPVAVAHRDDAAPEGVELIAVAKEAEPTTFSVFIERPEANMSSWPGKNAIGTVFGLYATKRGEWPRSLAVWLVCHLTPQCNSSRQTSWLPCD